MLIVNNYRDYEDDKAVGKHTTVVIFGREAMGGVYLGSGIMSLFLIFQAFSGTLSFWWLIPLAACLFILISLWRKITHSRGAGLNPLLGKTAMFLFGTSVLILLAVLTK